MNRMPDVELVLRDYFADDGLTAPDFILDVVEARIGRQPQRSSWPFPGRTNVTTPVKLIAGLAAAVVVAVVGYNLLPGRSGPGTPSTAPTPSALPTASVTNAPSAGVVFPEWFTPDSDSGAGILPAGTVTTRFFVPGSTFSVPAGWVNAVDSDVYGLFPDTPANEAEFALSDSLAQQIFMGIVDTPALGICEGVGDTHGSSAAELVESLVADEGLVTSEPVDVTIGGLTGVRVDAHLDPAWPGSCSKDFRGRYIFLDTPDGGKLLMIIDSVHAADFEAFLADAMPIVESFQFDFAQ